MTSRLIKSIEKLEIEVTKRTEAEDKLKKAHDGLEKEVEERTKELAKANNRLIGEIEDRKQTEEMLQRKTYDLDERVKELNCLYGISSLIEKPGISIGEVFQGLVDLVPPSWQYPEIASARILLEDKEYKTENFKETNWKQSSEIVVHGKHAGVLEICYLEERPEIDEGPFLKEERNHAYPDVAHTAISPRVHVQDGPMYPCIGARKSVALSGRRFSAHYRRPLMARIAD